MPLERFVFHGVGVELETDSARLAELLRRDFSFFSGSTADAPQIRVRAAHEAPPHEPLLARLQGRRTRNCVIYDAGERRFNVYPDEARVEFDFSRETALVHCADLNRLHEVVYLVIQSRVGKALDRRGLHRLHAMAVAIGGTAIVASLPMGVGKTTTFLEFIKDDTIEVISDDSPLVDGDGALRAFPVRIGVKADRFPLLKGHPSLDLSLAYEIDRMRYGRKHLVPMSAVSNSVRREPALDIVLVIGSRPEGLRECLVRKIPAWRAMPTLLRNLALGDGLPMMREYYIEGTRRDLRVIARIFFARLRATVALTMRARCLDVRFSADPGENVAALKSFLKLA